MGNPVTYQPPPGTSYQHQTPSTKHQAPSTKHHAPSTKYQVPSTKHHVPRTSTKHQAPNTKHQTPSTNCSNCCSSPPPIHCTKRTQKTLFVLNQGIWSANRRIHHQTIALFLTPIDHPFTNHIKFTRPSYDFDVLQIYEPYARKVKYYFWRENI